jgi:hypothetical protein
MASDTTTALVETDARQTTTIKELGYKARETRAATEVGIAGVLARCR